MTLREAAEQVGGWVAPEHYERAVSGVASLTEAGEGDISFFGNPKYLKHLRACRGTAVLVPHGFGETVPPACLWVDDPAAAFARLLKIFSPAPVVFEPGVHPSACIAPDATLGRDVTILPFAVIESGAVIGDRAIIGAHSYIGHGAKLGSDCHVYPHVTIRERSLIGNRVVFHPGVVIGSDGFGYEFRDGKYEKIPQTGIVQIDDDVEIGANSTIDRARFGRTWIQQGTKIDNLVHVAHNVVVGKHTILCGQVGISGSTRIGNYVTLAGKVGINGHIEIGDGAIVAAMSGITKTIPPKEIMSGLPAMPAKEFRKMNARMRNLDKLFVRVKKLEEK